MINFAIPVYPVNPCQFCGNKSKNFNVKIFALIIKNNLNFRRKNV